MSKKKSKSAIYFERPEDYNEVRVGIVGSRRYINSIRIKNSIFDLKNRFGNQLVIVSGGQPQGADGIAKSSALSLGVIYKEFPPAHYKWNPYCVKPEFFYNQQYYPGNFFIRNEEIVKYSDYVLCFINPGVKIEESRGTYDTYKRALKFLGEDKVVILN